MKIVREDGFSAWKLARFYLLSILFLSFRFLHKICFVENFATHFKTRSLPDAKILNCFLLLISVFSVRVYFGYTRTIAINIFSGVAILTHLHFIKKDKHIYIRGFYFIQQQWIKSIDDHQSKAKHTHSHPTYFKIMYENERNSLFKIHD